MSGQVFVCYPHPGDVSEPLMTSILKLIPFDSHRRKVVDSFTGYRGLYIHNNRNGLARMFLKSKYEWMWSLDSDISFEPQVLYHLLDSADPDKRPIVSGLYFTYIGEETSLRPCWFMRNPEGDYHVIREYDGGLQKIDGIGMGCALIHRSVYEKMLDTYEEPAPWFAHDIITMTTGKKIELGEDLTFSLRATNCGIAIYGNGAAQVDHWKRRRENIETFAARYAHIDPTHSNHLEVADRNGAE